MVPMYLLCCAQELPAFTVRRIAAFDLLLPLYPLSRCCGGIWIVFFSSAASAPRHSGQRRADETQALPQGTVGRDARIRRLKQHDLTPKREDGNSSPCPRNKRGLGLANRSCKAPPEPNPNASLVSFCASRKKLASADAKQSLCHFCKGKKRHSLAAASFLFHFLLQRTELLRIKKLGQ